MQHGVQQASQVVRRVIADYHAGKGVVSDGSRKLDSDMLASPTGGLPALLYWASVFYTDWEIPFASLQVSPNASAYSGFELLEILPEAPSAGSMLAFFANFMHDEIFNPAISPTIDLSSLLGEFPEWCRSQLVGQHGPSTDNHQPD